MWIEYYLSVLEQHRGEEAHVAVGDVQTPMIRHFFLQRTDVGWSERVKKGVKYHLRNKLVKKKKKLYLIKKKVFPLFLSFPIIKKDSHQSQHLNIDRLIENTFLFLTMEQVLAFWDFRKEFVECFVVLYKTLRKRQETGV